MINFIKYFSSITTFLLFVSHAQAMSCQYLLEHSNNITNMPDILARARELEQASLELQYEAADTLNRQMDATQRINDAAFYVLPLKYVFPPALGNPFIGGDNIGKDLHYVVKTNYRNPTLEENKIKSLIDHLFLFQADYALIRGSKPSIIKDLVLTDWISIDINFSRERLGESYSPTENNSPDDRLVTVMSSIRRNLNDNPDLKEAAVEYIIEHAKNVSSADNVIYADLQVLKQTSIIFDGDFVSLARIVPEIHNAYIKWLELSDTYVNEYRIGLRLFDEADAETISIKLPSIIELYLTISKLPQIDSESVKADYTQRLEKLFSKFKTRLQLQVLLQNTSSLSIEAQDWVHEILNNI